MDEFWNNLKFNNDAEQLKRQKSAQDKKLTPINIDTEAKIGFFKGSGKNPYTVSLSHCTCGDFIRRNLPCKHMYRLAHELNLFNLGEVASTDVILIKSTESKDIVLDKLSGEIFEFISIDEAKIKIDTLSLKELSIVTNIFEALKEDTPYIIEDSQSDIINKLIDFSLFSRKEIVIDKRLSYYQKDTLINILNTIDADAVKTLKARCQTKTVYNLLISTYRNELDSLFKSNYVCSKNINFDDSYGKLAHYSKKVLYSYFKDTDLCLKCFEDKYKLTLEPYDYIERGTYYLCDSCYSYNSIKILKEIYDKNNFPEAKSNISKYTIEIIDK